MIHLLKRTSLAAGILLALTSPLYSPEVLAAPGDPVGIEFQVNTETSNSQGRSSIAMDANGNFVVAWHSGGSQDGSDYGIYAQRYLADGSAAGDEFLVNSTTNDPQTYPSIAMDPEGNFVIAWQSLNQDGSEYGVYAQRYQANGSAAGNEFLVNSVTGFSQKDPSIAMDADGGFVITWEGRHNDNFDIAAQRYLANGNVVGGQFLVSIRDPARPNDRQFDPSIAMAANGDFVIAWMDTNPQGGGEGIFAQRFQADGTVVGEEFLVNTSPSVAQMEPSVAMDANGDFVIAWQSYVFNAGFTAEEIFARRYQADGTAAGDEFKVNTTSFSAQRNPSIALDADANFVITWESNSQDGSGYGIYAQRYQADGTVAGGEFQVNTTNTDDQLNPSIALGAAGDFVIAWQSLQNGSNYDIYAQRYDGMKSLVVDLNLELQDDIDPVAVGSSFVYSLIVANNGTDTATDVDLSNPIPTGLSYVSDDAASAGWSCALTGTTINCNKPLMSAGEVNSIDITVTADEVGTLSNTVTVTATQTDIDNSNNTATETTTVIDTAAPVITLLGSNPISVTQNTVHADPGVTITDNVDTGLVATVTGSVDTAIVGSYTLSYNVNDNAGNAAIEVERTVIVVDATIPVITLVGDNPLSVTQNTVFTDPGATLTDNVDTGLIATVTGSVDTTTAGNYTLSYNVSDNAGNDAIEVQRSVVVVAAPVAMTSNSSGGSFSISALLLGVTLWLRRRRQDQTSCRS